MASLYKKVISGRPYWYLREMGWVDGKPKMISERYVGTAAEVEALLDAREERMLPERTRHLDFGAVAAAWGLLADLGVAAIIDQEAGADPSGLPLSPGTYLALAALNRAVDPCSKRGFADWWRTTAADRFTKIPVSALDHRRFWDAMHAVPLEALPRIEEKVALAACARFGLDTGSVALDMTNFATFIDTGNDKAPIAQRGKAKQKRADLRLVGLGLVVTRDGGIPLLSHAYPGSKPDVTQFPEMIKTLAARHAVLAAAAGQQGTEMTVVFDAGQNSEANFALLAGTNLHYVGSVPASDCRDLLALPASARTIVDEGRFGGLTAYDTRRRVYGTERRVILTHSPELHAHQARGFDGTTDPAGLFAARRARCSIRAAGLARMLPAAVSSSLPSSRPRIGYPMSMQPAAWPEPDPQIAAAVAAMYARRKTPRPLAVQIRDRLGQWLHDEEFASAFGERGRPGWSPSRLALVTVLQRAEKLTDRLAANAVRMRMDWKYLMGLPVPRRAGWARPRHAGWA